FFQAEDGIRDFHVTGVQTCALPILQAPVPAVDPRPLLTMDDMGHGGHGGHGRHAAAPEGGCGAAMAAEGACGARPAPASHDAHAAHGGGGMQSHPASESGNPLVDMQTMTPSPRL